MLARRRRRDAAKRVPPQPDRPHRSSSRQRVTPLIGEGRGHVVAEVAAELRREEPQQATEDSVSS